MPLHMHFYQVIAQILRFLKYISLDDDIIACSPHLDHLPVLAGYLGVPDRCLEQIQNDYSLKRIQGYWVLKKYKELNPQASLTHLIKVLKLLGLKEAVERYNYDTMHDSNDNNYALLACLLRNN